MGDKIEIILLIDSPNIASVHSTITSIINQLNMDHFDCNIYFSNPSNLNIQSEILRLKDAKIKTISTPENQGFQLILTSGTTISRSYLYKAIHYLKRNPQAFTCPEYTFSKIDSSPIITTIQNNNLTINCVKALVKDNSKLSNVDSIDHIPRATAIKNTCASTPVINISFSKYLKSLKKAKNFFFDPSFLPCHLLEIKEPLESHRQQKRKLTSRLFSAAKSISGNSKILHKLFDFIVSWHDNSPADIKTLKNKNAPYISDAMRNELSSLSTIDYSLKGFLSMNYYDITHEFSLTSEKLFYTFKTIAPIANKPHYDYIMVLPWLISGGIDLFATNYLKTIAQISPDKHILVILTNNTHKSFTKEELDLPTNIDLLDLPKVLPKESLYPALLDELLYSLITIHKPARLHIIASKVGYDCLIEHGANIRSNGTKIIFSSYNYLTGTRGEYIGYTVQELPKAYVPGDIVTTDNLESKNLWVNQYGFLSDDILVHSQLFDIPEQSMAAPSTKDGIKILWAAHIRPEKNPEIIPKIAAALKNDHIEIDCYGLFNSDNWENENNPLVTNLPNLHYKGPYNDFFNDIQPSNYDLFLYTSHADGTPNVILEAALAGLPIISSAIGGIPDATRGKAYLIQDSSSVDQFVDAIKYTIAHLPESAKQAQQLQKELQEPHSIQTFTAQVNEMLERSK